MKVLFAVSSEEISEKIIKRYQKEYKEILSYKNVYYFNAILKEIQKDKTYDRIVISEDLEPFANNNYDTIDKFIFDRLDSISDEAHDNQGKETAIILICTERRTKGSSILLKLFGIGIYNALLGNDRSMEQVCKLINRPRGKKEAKQYYQIDTEDVNYKAENENEVSELEIQNILTHFKKLGRNTDRYADSFNNIASQYTEEQLKIIINCLPINVKAVLEEKSPRYQEIMSVTGTSRVGENASSGQKLKNAGLKIDIIKNNEKQQMNGPIVIPSTIRTSKVSKSPNIQKPVAKEPVSNVNTQRPAGEQAQNRRIIQAHRGTEAQNQQDQNVGNVQTAQAQVLPRVVRPVSTVATQATTKAETVTNVQRPRVVQEQAQNVNRVVAQESVQPVENVPGNILNGVEDNQEPIKKGRGRPRKILAPEEDKPKGKRGRPKKVEAQEEQDVLPGVDDDLNNLLPGMEDLDDILPGVEETNDVVLPKTNSTTNQKQESEDDLSSLLPGLEDDDINNLLPGLDEDENSDVLPGLNEQENTNNSLPDLDEEDDGLLPGIDAISEDDTEQEEFLPGMEEDKDAMAANVNRQNQVRNATFKQPASAKIEPIANENDISSLLPEMNFEDEVAGDESDYTEEVSLPGLDELDDLEPEEENDSENLDSLLPGIEPAEEDVNQNNADDIVDYNEYEDSANDDLLPGMDKDETLLPGMGFVDDDSNDIISNEQTVAQTPPAQKVKPAHSYTVKSGGLRNRNILPNKKKVEPTYNANTTDTTDALDYTDNYQDYNNYSNTEDLSNNDYNMYNDNSYQNNYNMNSNQAESLKPKVDYSMSNLNSLLTQDKKIVTFIGTTKNGTSFLVNNLASIFSSLGINTAILDMTKNRNSYYIYTKNEEELRKIAYNSIEKLENGYAEGIRVDKNLTVYTALPNDGKIYSDAEPILSTLVQNHSVVLIDCDFDTDPSYFASCQEIYLVQSLDILTIQPLTAFLRDLKTKGVLEPEKVRVVINKDMKVGNLTNKVIIAGMSFYNDPAMSFMTELFNKDMVKYCVIPFDEKAYSKYLEAIVDCRVSYNSYPSNFINKLKMLGDMVYPLTSKQAYGKQTNTYSKPNNSFSNSMNNTLNKMRKKY